MVNHIFVPPAGFSFDDECRRRYTIVSKDGKPVLHGATEDLKTMITPDRRWITKHALEQGVVEQQGQLIGGWFRTDTDSYVLGEEAFTNLADAQENARKRRDNKLRRLQRDVERLQNLKFGD